MNYYRAFKINSSWMQGEIVEYDDLRLNDLVWLDDEVVKVVEVRDSGITFSNYWEEE